MIVLYYLYRYKNDLVFLCYFVIYDIDKFFKYFKIIYKLKVKVFLKFFIFLILC